MQGTWQVRGRLAMAVAAWIPAAALLAVAPPMVFAQASPGQTQANPGQTHSGPAGSAAFQALAAKATTARDAERLDEAVPLFRKALALNPKWAEGWWSLGTIEYDRNQYDAAAREFQKL